MGGQTNKHYILCKLVHLEGSQMSMVKKKKGNVLEIDEIKIPNEKVGEGGREGGSEGGRI